MKPELNKIYTGDTLAIMRQWPDAFIQTCVTSPPYWGLRDYGTAVWDGGDSRCDHLQPCGIRQDGGRVNVNGFNGSSKENLKDKPYRNVCGKCSAVRIDSQLGLEKTPEEYTAKMVEVFREVRRVLRDDGTLWLNLGDSYAGSGKGAWDNKNGGQKEVYIPDSNSPQTNIEKVPAGLKAKDLVGIPWRVAFALQADGWYLRSDIIWHKPNPMPESVTDRPTKAHEYLFLLTKNERYYYDSNAIKEPAIYFGINGIDETGYKDAETFSGKHHKTDKQRGHGRRHAGFNDRWDQMEKSEQCSGMRNKRDVWTIATMPYAEAHFATFPPDLIKPCILAGSPEGGLVLDPFMGAGTTALVALTYNRQFIGTELNPEYVTLAETRIANEQSQVKMPL